MKHPQLARDEGRAAGRVDDPAGLHLVAHTGLLDDDRALDLARLFLEGDRDNLGGAPELGAGLGRELQHVLVEA